MAGPGGPGADAAAGGSAQALAVTTGVPLDSMAAALVGKAGNASPFPLLELDKIFGDLSANARFANDLHSAAVSWQVYDFKRPWSFHNLG